MAPREINPRRAILPVLRSISKHIGSMVATWADPPSTRWYDAGDGRGSHWQVKRRKRADIPAAEYQENQPEEWERLAKFMEAVAIQALDVATYAKQQRAKAIERQRAPR